MISKSNRRCVAKALICNLFCASIFVLICALVSSAYAEDCLRAMEYLHQGVELSDNSEKEERLYRDAIAMCEPMSEAHFNLGVVLFERGEYEDAKEAFLSSIKRKGSVAAYIGLGNTYMQIRGYDAAVDAYKKALESDTNSFAALIGVGVAQSHLQQYDKAQDAIRQAIQISSDKPEGYYNLGVVLTQAGKATEALVEYEHALEKDKTFVLAARHLARAYANRNELDRAMEVLDSVINANTSASIPASVMANVKVDAMLAKADILIQANMLERAIEVIKSVNVSDLTEASHQMSFAVLKVKAGDAAGGVEFLRNLATKHAQDGAYHSMLGWALVKAGDYPSAQTALTKASTLTHSDPFVHNNLGVVLEHLGQNAAAQREYKIALELSPDMEQAKSNLARFGQ